MGTIKGSLHQLVIFFLIFFLCVVRWSERWSGGGEVWEWVRVLG